MADFSPSKKTISDFNNGQKYRNGVDTPNADDFNGVIESQLWTQSLATNQPNIENVSGSGTPSVSIEQTGNGTPRFKFENLGGGSATQNGDLSIIATFNITEVNTTITLQDLIGMTSIDWGDGTKNNSLTHTYTEVGEYTCKIYGVTEIGRYAFQGLEALSSISIIENVASIGEYAVGNCSGLDNVYIGSCVTNVGDYSFYSSGLKRLIIDNGVMNIGRAAFNTCVNLISVTIPDSVKSIDWGAFANCASLVSVTIGDGIISIGESVFQNCPKLSIIEIKAIAPPTIGINAFLYNYAFEKNIVPIESLETYKTAEGWSDYATLICSEVYTSDRNEFVKEGITQNTETLTDEQKTSACEWLGAVTKEEFGSIETALDSIISIQNSLIGGDTQ